MASMVFFLSLALFLSLYSLYQAMRARVTRSKHMKNAPSLLNLL